MAAKKASKKKTSKKRTATRTKQAAKKKKAPAKAALSPKAKVFVVKESGEPILDQRKEIKAAVPSGGITVEALMAKTDCRRVTIEAMVRKGFIETR